MWWELHIILLAAYTVSFQLFPQVKITRCIRNWDGTSTSAQYPLDLCPVSHQDFEKQLADFTLISLLHDTKWETDFETQILSGVAHRNVYILKIGYVTVWSTPKWYLQIPHEYLWRQTLMLCPLSFSVCSGETEGHVWGRVVYQSVCGKCCWDPHSGWSAQCRPAQNAGGRLHQLVSSHSDVEELVITIIRSPAPLYRLADPQEPTEHFVSVVVSFCYIFFILASLLVVPGLGLTLSPHLLVSQLII